MPASYIPILTIAGSDPTGGAGIQADMKSISALGCYPLTAVTAITAQNSTGVKSVEGVSPKLVEQQIRAAVSDMRPKAVKTGMLHSPSTVSRVAATLRDLQLNNLIVDPVIISTSGHPLLSGDRAIATLRDELIPLSTLTTPNEAELRMLTGFDDIDSQLSSLHGLGCRNILLKGGESNPESQLCSDILSLDYGERRIVFSSPRIFTDNTHGTGCTFSAAIAAWLGIGKAIEESVRLAKKFISCALAAGAEINTGTGHGPMNHFFNPKPFITI